MPDHIARLNTDGSTDTSFAPATPPNAEAHCVQVMNDGRIVAGGAFTTPRNRLAVFNSNGSLNAVNVPANWDVYGLTKQTDGKLIVVGRFTTLGDAAHDRTARLTSALTMEPAFDPTANGTVRVATVKPDGKIMVAGAFTGMGDRARDRIARLFNDPADSTLTVIGASLVQWTRSGAGQETARVTFELDAGGGYAAIPGTIARISGGWTLVPATPLSGSGTVRARAFPEDSHSDGIHEALRVFSFVPEIAVELDGVDIASGGSLDFGSMQSGAGAERTLTIRNTGLANLTITLPVVLGGTAMASYSVLTAPTTPVTAGGFTTCKIRLNPTTEGTKVATLTITNNDASEGTFVINLTGTATPGSGSPDLSWQPTSNEGVLTVATKNTECFIGGFFTAVNGVGRSGFARLQTAAGAAVIAQSGTGANGAVQCSVYLPEGKIIIGGIFTAVNGVSRPNLARLNADGTLDTSFNLAVNGAVWALAVQPDGAVLVSGAFTLIGGVARSGFARIVGNAVDAGFNVPTVNAPRLITVQPDSKILISVLSLLSGGVLRRGLARLLPSGALDTSFSDPAILTAADTYVNVTGVAVQADGKILVAGADIGKVGGVARVGVARLNADGSLDAIYLESGGDKFGVILQADGRSISWRQTLNTLRRADAVNTTDASLISAVGSNVYTVALQADGKLLCGLGNGAMITRLINEDSASSALAVTSASRVQWQRGGTAPEAQFVTFELSEDAGVTWVMLGTGTRMSGGWEKTLLNLPIDGQIRARARCGGGIMEAVQVFSGLLVPDLDVTRLVTGAAAVSVADGGSVVCAGVLPTQTSDVTLKLRNSGLATLTGLTLTMTGAEFSVISLDLTTLEPGQVATAIIRCTPSATGVRSGVLDITSNVPGDKAVYRVTLTGYGITNPAAITDAATLITSAAARLPVRVTANADAATAYVRYRRAGTADAWTLSPVPAWDIAGFTVVPLYRDIGSLIAATSYEFQAVAINAVSTKEGTLRTFSTLA
ncbi:MAG: choice-of-anchor D domain-containing protein [Prosthecobacter sp.]